MSCLWLGSGSRGQSLLDEMLQDLGFGVSCDVGWGMVDFECFWKRSGLGLAGEGKASQQQVQKIVSEGREWGTR